MRIGLLSNILISTRSETNISYIHSYDFHVYIYIIYTPNLGLEISIFDREREQGLLPKLRAPSPDSLRLALVVSAMDEYGKFSE